MIPNEFCSIIADGPYVLGVLFKHTTILLFLGCPYEVQREFLGRYQSQHLVVTTAIEDRSKRFFKFLKHHTVV